MIGFRYPNCPLSVRSQLDRFVAAFQDTLGGGLTGIYLHGSLALGCFNPALSDLDLLVVVRSPLAPDRKRALIAALLPLSRAPCPVEMSVLTEEQLHPWRYPTPFELHYSEEWRDAYEAELSSGAWRMWQSPQGEDTDLAAHITILHRYGIVLVGAPIAAVFPPVPEADYCAALLNDFQGIGEHITNNPVYWILTSCRIWLYLTEGAILSKQEGGQSALTRLSGEWQPLVAQALAMYQGLATEVRWDVPTLHRFAAFMNAQVAAALAVRRRDITAKDG